MWSMYTANGSDQFSVVGYVAGTPEVINWSTPNGEQGGVTGTNSALLPGHTIFHLTLPFQATYSVRIQGEQKEGFIQIGPNDPFPELTISTSDGDSQPRRLRIARLTSIAASTRSLPAPVGDGEEQLPNLRAVRARELHRRHKARPERFAGFPLPRCPILDWCALFLWDAQSSGPLSDLADNAAAWQLSHGSAVSAGRSRDPRSTCVRRSGAVNPLKHGDVPPGDNRR